MGELYEKWLAQKVFQSEGGSAGAIHRAASGGTFATIFPASQGLLLKLPNMSQLEQFLTGLRFLLDMQSQCKFS